MDGRHSNCWEQLYPRHFHFGTSASAFRAREERLPEPRVPPAPMAAAATKAMVPAPPAPAPRPAWNIAASLARAHHRLALAADDAAVRLLLVAAVGDAFLCLSLASGWILAAGFATMDVGRVVCGVDCAVTLAGVRVILSALLALAVFYTPALLVFVIRAAKADLDTDEVEGYDLEFEGSVPRSLAAAGQEVCSNTVKLGILATVPFILLGFIGGLLEGNSHVKKSGIGAVGKLGIDVLLCFIIIPTAALRVWRVTRPGWQCCSEVEKTP